MNIVLLESLGVPESLIEGYAGKLRKMGHHFTAYSRCTDPEVLTQRCQDADVIMLANMPLDAAVLDHASHLQYINVAFTGLDHIPVQKAREKGIEITNAAGYATQAVAELAIALMIQLLRHVDETQVQCRTGGTKTGLVGTLLQGKTVGIVGAGAIGKRTAALCKAFGCRVVAYNRSQIEDPSVDEQVSLEELLRQADIVSLHVPLTDSTEGLIGRKELASMKPSALLINTARGPVVDTEALAQALQAQTIAGAACDVFDMEPPLPQDFPLLHTPHTIVTPHIGFASEESMELRCQIVFEKLYAWLDQHTDSQS